MLAEPLWQLESVRLPHHHPHQARGALDLTIPQGITALLGPSGAGKSTLLHQLAGFEPIVSGRIRKPQTIAWVPQTLGLWPECTALEHLTFCGSTMEDAHTLLARFDLSPIANRRAAHLSLGESARLAVARAFAGRATALLMDEPLAHVDAARAESYWETLRALLMEKGCSLIFATHQPGFALATANHAICLRESRVDYNGPMASLYENPSSESLAAHLGPCNWLTTEDAQHWLNEKWPTARGIRPERVAVLMGGDATVVQSIFYGTHATSVLRSSQGCERTFFHRPASPLGIGAKVCVRIVGEADISA